MDLLDILCTMGLPTIDKTMATMLDAMKGVPEFVGTTESMASSIGCCIALGVGSYECWMMMLGKRGIDVMKILRIAIISICITTCGGICDAAAAPGKHLEDSAKKDALAKNAEVAAVEKKVATLQTKYLDRLRAVQDSIAQAEKVAEIGEDADWWMNCRTIFPIWGTVLTIWRNKLHLLSRRK